MRTANFPKQVLAAAAVLLFLHALALVEGQACDVGQQPADPCLFMVGSTCAGPTCEACPVGRYSPQVNEAVCISCPTDSSTENTGAMSLDQCECNRGFTRASPCADPATCRASLDPPTDTISVRAVTRDFLSLASGLGGHADFGAMDTSGTRLSTPAYSNLLYRFCAPVTQAPSCKVTTTIGTRQPREW